MTHHAGGLPLGRPRAAPAEHRFPALEKLPLQCRVTAVARVGLASRCALTVSAERREGGLVNQ